MNPKDLKVYWARLQEIEFEFYKEVERLEKIMEKQTGIKGIEFFWSDGYCGIGTADRKMKLVQAEELE